MTKGVSMLNENDSTPMIEGPDFDQASGVEPFDPAWTSLLSPERWRGSMRLASDTTPRDFLIDGWLPTQGTSVWFGAGSTGKTQLMLWMAATIASREQRRTWLGGEVRRSGHVLVLTAEDSEQHVRGRIEGIVRHTLGQSDEVAEDTCARLHVMAFLSMAEHEYRHPNASLFENPDRLWRPTAVLEGVRRYIEEWNAREDEDPILGVVMDSATSMCGFDSMDGHATTNFFFYLGRLCETLGIFWAIIGHVPKSAVIQKRDTRAGAANRLRGVTMWTTAPRLVVEVRQLHEWREEKKLRREHPALRDALPEVRREDLLVVYAAKTNLKGVEGDERYLKREEFGAFQDVTALVPHPHSTTAIADIAASVPLAPETARPAAKDHGEGTDAVVHLIDAVYPSKTAGTLVAAQRLYDALQSLPAELRPPGADAVTSPNGGGKTQARPGSVTWHMDRLVDRGWLVKKTGRYRVADWQAPAAAG